MEEKKLVGYFLAGYPNEADSLEILKSSALAGIDIFEIGYPSADPYCDGDVIRQAHMRVVSQGYPDMAYWLQLRQTVSKPIWIMAYREGFVDNGTYLEMARQRVVDALVLPDCDDDERRRLQQELAPLNVEVLGFAGMQTPEADYRKILAEHRLIYLQLHSGKTGNSAVEGDPGGALKIAEEYPNTKLFAGFGINSASRARDLVEQGFEGVIVGTEFVRKLQHSEDALAALIREMHSAVHRKG